MDKLASIAVVELNSAILKLLGTVLNRIEKAKIEGAKFKSIVISDNDSDVGEAKLIEKELDVITTTEKLTLKILSQLQDYVYQDVNLGEIKKKITNRMFEGLESNYIDTENPLKSNKTKLNVIKDSHSTLTRCLTLLLTLRSY